MCLPAYVGLTERLVPRKLTNYKYLLTDTKLPNTPIAIPVKIDIPNKTDKTVTSNNLSGISPIKPTIAGIA